MHLNANAWPLLALMLGAALHSQSAAAADGKRYPNRPIRFIMPYPVGGTIDMSGRMVAQQVGDNVGQQVVVDNRTGAGGTLGTEMAAKAPPDGYTIVMGGTGTLAVSPGLGRSLGQMGESGQGIGGEGRVSLVAGGKCVEPRRAGAALPAAASVFRSRNATSGKGR